TDAVTHKKIVNKRIYKFVYGLNKNLNEIRCRILATKSLPNIREVFSQRHEESRRRLMLGSGPSVNQTKSSALIAHNSNFQRENQQQCKGRRPWCEHCSRPRHTKESC
ncbi:hypothetical protein PanWU01x14_301150, partial [Parasponia andersonii]